MQNFKPVLTAFFCFSSRSRQFSTQLIIGIFFSVTLLKLRNDQGPKDKGAQLSFDTERSRGFCVSGFVSSLDVKRSRSFWQKLSKQDAWIIRKGCSPRFPSRTRRNRKQAVFERGILMAPKCLDTDSPSHLGKGHQTSPPGGWAPTSEGLRPPALPPGELRRPQLRDAPRRSFVTSVTDLTK